MEINHIILKVASICNLSCDYCYVFNKQDKSYLIQNNVMTYEIARTLINRIEKYLSRNTNKTICITFHGGEPLMAGKLFYEQFASELHSKVGNRAMLSIQTNGTLIDKEWCDIFKKYKIAVGISIDGDKEANIHRKDKDNVPAYDRIINGYILLVKNGLTPGILSVINTKQSPQDYYNYLKSIDAKYVDCLFPDATYDTYDFSCRGIGMWLCQLFCIWINDKNRFSIRLFESIIKLVIKPYEKVGGEMFGNTSNGVIDINSNGDIDIPDTLRICNKEMKTDHYDIFNNNLNNIFREDIFQRFYDSHSNKYLADKCKKCVIKNICGGGILAHRYSKNNSYDHPSVYCYDLICIICYIQHFTCENLKQKKIERIDINDFKSW